ncbi:MAG: lytic transglycosylase domain-containing protein, partial [Caulobacteraceae bacterium]|nr:lytic transglycosylase domain-containing protein [Caulobacteraceae bacterium]
MPLSFQKDLDDEQVDFAIKVAEKAKQLGIDPNLAVSVAYQESRLRPNVGSSPKGALGIMQVMPGTAKAYGVDKKELIDPDTNIDVGVRVLKDMLDKFPDDPRLAVVAYNAGPAHPFFAGGELPKETENYLRSLKEFGAFESQPQVAEVQPEPQAPQVQP